MTDPARELAELFDRSHGMYQSARAWREGIQEKIMAWHERHSPRVPTQLKIRETLMRYGSIWKFDKDTTTFRTDEALEEDLLALFSEPERPSWCFHMRFDSGAWYFEHGLKDVAFKHDAIQTLQKCLYCNAPKPRPEGA